MAIQLTAETAAAFRHLEFLAGQCGPRPAGSPSAVRARGYIADALERLGMDVAITPISAPRYALVTSRLRAARSGGWREVEHKPVWFAGDTGCDAIQAELVDGGDGSEAFLGGGGVADKVVLIARDVYVDYPDVVLTDRLLRHRPAAVLYTTRAGYQGGPPDVYYNYRTVESHPPPPSAVIDYAAALDLLRRPPRLVEYQAQYRVEAGTCAHVVATLAGSDPRAGRVVVCAHYDSVPGSPGAADDAGGVAVVLALAERLSAQARRGQPPRQTVTFVAWSGHETGVHGSSQFLGRHPEFVASCRFALNFDGIGSRLHLNQMLGCGSPEVLAAVQGRVAGCGYEWPMSIGPGGLDVINLTAVGVPWVSLGQGLTAWAHTPLDDVDSCSPGALAAPLVAAWAILEWAVEAAEIPRGYPPALAADAAEYCARFGWGPIVDED